MKISWRGAIGLALTVFLLWWVFRDVDWRDVARELEKANLFYVTLSVVAATLIFPLRAQRWRYILASVAPNLPFGPAWRATAIGMMANMLLPARAGELVRPFVLSRQTSVPFSAGLASIVVDRVFDAVSLLLLMLVAIFDPRFPADVSASNYIGTGVLIFVAIVVVLYAVVFFPDRLIEWFEIVAQRVAPRFEQRGRAMLRAFADGLSVLRHPAHFAAVFVWAIAHWLMNGLAFWLMFLALKVPAPFTAALFLQALIVIGVKLPSTPGFFGFFEAMAKTGLVLYGVSEQLTVAWANTFHVLSLIPIIVIGLYYLARSGLQLGELKEIKR